MDEVVTKKTSKVNIKRLQITCKDCGSVLVFDIQRLTSIKALITCQVCGTLSGITTENSPVEKIKELITSIENTEIKSTISFLCEEE